MRIPTSSLLCVLLVACGRAGADPAPPLARPIRAAEVVDTTAARPIVAAGVLGARQETDLAFTVAGLVSRVAVQAGERVRAGQVLATLDPQQVDASVRSARAAVDKAERDAARARRLFADSVIARSSLQDAETALTAAEAELEAASFARRTATITAPADGIVQSVIRDPGSVVGPGAPVLRFAATGRGSVFRAGLTDRDAVAVQLGDSARVTLDALPGETLEGVVVERAGSPTSGTGTYAVEIQLRAVADLPRGLAGTATIARRASGSVRMVPIAALVEADRERGVVFALEDDRVTRREVRIAFLAGDRVAIAGGLDGARRVVTDGAAYLSDGERVREVAP